jgi:hypothetical protein
MKRLLLGFVAALALMMPFAAAEKADAQVVVQYGPRYHRPYYHHYYYRSHYYGRPYYHHGYYGHRGYYHHY